MRSICLKVRQIVVEVGPHSPRSMVWVWWSRLVLVVTVTSSTAPPTIHHPAFSMPPPTKEAAQAYIEQHGLQAQMQAALQYVVNEMPPEPLLALAKLCASPALLLNPPHPFENIPLILNPLIVGAFHALAASPRRTRSSSRRHTMRRMRTRTPTRRAIRSARSSCSLIRMAMASST